MLVSFILAFLSISPLAAGTRLSHGCEKQLPHGQQAGGFYNATIDERRYVVFVPPEYSCHHPTSAVLSYHGGSETPEAQIALDQFTNCTFNTRKMVVYPQGTPKPGCNGSTCEEYYWDVDPDIHADDVGFTEDVLDALESTYCLDLDRVFASGKSQGGGFVNQAACDPGLSTRIAAFAPVSGSFYVNTSRCDPDIVKIQCNPGRRKIPMLEFHGGNDTTIAYDGGARKGECLPTIPHWIQEWALRDELGLHNRSSQLFHFTPNTTKFVWGHGAETGLVTHIFDAAIAHDWPYKYENSDNVADHPATFDATPIILDFFDSHPLPLFDSRPWRLGK